MKYTRYSTKESKEIDKLVKGVGKQVSNKIVKSKRVR